MLKLLSEYITYRLLKLQLRTHIADPIELIIYNTLQIFILLSVIIFAVSIIRSYFPTEKTKHILSHKTEFIGSILAVVLGVATPYSVDPG